MKSYLPIWTHQWLGVAPPLLQVALVLAAAWLLARMARRLVNRSAARWELPPEVRIGARRISGFLIYSAALMLILERLGVSGAVLWTAFTGFAAVAAVAFFAAWSVLSNIFCAVLLLITRPFRLHDHIEILDGSEGRGLGGQVVDMNLISVTLRETRDGAQADLRVPNSLFFQRITRRWREAPPPRPEPAPADAAAAGKRRRPAPPAGGGGSLV